MGKSILRKERITLPPQVVEIIRTLEGQGYEAYAVGGCVRDSLLGREPNDWDITTSARPGEVKALFARTVDTGLQHGTVTVLLDGIGFEVTTYRIDGDYEDGRHPKSVTFTVSLEEDLKRRDFTINAMACHPDRGLVDLFGGITDLKQGVIRCVGEPLERFTEDALRILRAVRFCAQLGFTMETRTREAIREIAPNLQKVSTERIQTELVKLLVSPHPEYLRIAYETGMTAYFLPEWDRCMTTAQNNPHHIYTVGEHSLRAMQLIRPDKVLRLTMMLHDIAKPLLKTTDENGIDHFKKHAPAGEKLAEDILRRLKFDNDTIRTVCCLIYWHDSRPKPDGASVRRAINRIGEEYFPLYLEVQRADLLAQSTYCREEKLDRLDKVCACYQEILTSRDCISLRTLAVNGRDLIEAGCRPGKELGRILQLLLEYVLEHPEENRKEALLEKLSHIREEEYIG